MCFFVLHRYRVCQHDQIGQLVTLCTTAKALASSSKDKNIQSSPREWYGAHEGLPYPIIRSNDAIELGYCGQPLFSPAYIIDSGPGSANRGICQNCVNIKTLTTRHSLKRELQNAERTDGERTGNSARPEGNTVGQLGSNQFSQRPRPRHLQQTAIGLANSVPFESHVFGPRASDSAYTPRTNCYIPPQPSFHHPLFQIQQPIQRTTYTPYNRQLLPDCLPCFRPPAASGSLENPTNIPVTLQQMLYNYPLQTRLAIEKAVANQPLEQRMKTLQTLRASFEEGVRQRRA